MSDDDPPFSLGFEEPGAGYVSGSQRARIFTESWVAAHLFCPACGARRIARHVANRPVADFHCLACGEEFELKSQRGRFGDKVLDGAYGAKLQRLASDTSPNLALMNYDLARFAVTDLFFTPPDPLIPAKAGTQAGRAAARPKEFLGHEKHEKHERSLAGGPGMASVAIVRAFRAFRAFRGSLGLPPAWVPAFAGMSGIGGGREAGGAAPGWLIEVMKRRDAGGEPFCTRPYPLHHASHGPPPPLRG